VKAGKNELELAGIPIDVPDRENAGDTGFETCCFDRDQLVIVQLKAPIRHRSELHRQSEERQQRVAGDFKIGTIVPLDDRLMHLTVGSVERGNLPKHEIDFAFADERHHFVDAVRGGAEFAAAVQQCQMACDRREVEGPIEGAVAAAHDQNPLAAKRLHFAHGIKNRFAFIWFDSGDRRALGLE
jgi:hypothetical protein